MCGICGFVGFNNDNLLQEMMAVLVHRGPDDSGSYSDDYVNLGMRRLSIIDLETGNQPIFNENRTVVVVSNGEIYNFKELKAHLLRRGHRFKTKSDTEVLVHLYEDHGVDFVKYLRGMFAIALWDKNRKKLILARDRVGEKPLYYYSDREGLIFASEIKSILANDSVPREVNYEALSQYLSFMFVPAPLTMFKNIFKLLPGNILVIENGRQSLQQYWDLDVEAAFGDVKRESDHIMALKKEFDNVAKMTLLSDVPVGVFLSGGLDSSLVLAAASQHTSSLNTFSIGFGSEASGYDELSYASVMAKRFATQHHEIIVRPNEMLDSLAQVVWHLDEPLACPPTVLSYILSKHASQVVKVALSGTGGDEVFLGYSRYTGILLAKYYNILPNILRNKLQSTVLGRIKEATDGSRRSIRIRRFLAGASNSLEETFVNWRDHLDAGMKKRLLTADAHAEVVRHDSHDVYRRHFADAGNADILNKLMYVETKTYLSSLQLDYNDKMSMANSLELRSPLVDHKLVELSGRIPGKLKLKHFSKKYMLKEIARPFLPDEIINRKKVGFENPAGLWFKNSLSEFLDGLLSPANLRRTGIFDGDGVASLIQTHRSGKRNFADQLWAIVNFELWYRIFIEGDLYKKSSIGLDDVRH